MFPVSSCEPEKYVALLLSNLRKAYYGVILELVTCPIFIQVVRAQHENGRVKETVNHQ